MFIIGECIWEGFYCIKNGIEFCIVWVKVYVLFVDLIWMEIGILDFEVVW